MTFDNLDFLFLDLSEEQIRTEDVIVSVFDKNHLVTIIITIIIFIVLLLLLLCRWVTI